jgi:hypothetical protein
VGWVGGRVPYQHECVTAQRYQDHQIEQGVQDAVSGGLYTRIVLRDFLPEYPGRAAFVPGLSEYGATKPWPGSPITALQRAVTMFRRLNLHGIPRDIREALRELQDIYSEPINLADESSDDDTNDETEHSHESEGENDTGDRGQSYHIKDSITPQQAGFEDGFAPGGGRPQGGGDNRNATALEAEFTGDELKEYNDRSTKSPLSQSDVCLTPPSLAIQVSSRRDSYGWSRHWRWGHKPRCDEIL